MRIMIKEESLAKVKILVDRFNSLSEQEKNQYNEEQTKGYFIRPLFEALGWDFSNSNEVSFEEKVAGGKRADYEFKLNGIPKVYLEAKSIKTDLDLEQHARQAINYAWNKGVTWAVLTDFESIKVFNAQGQSKLLADKMVFEILCAEYLTDERLWLLSKESFLEGGLDKYAEKYSKKIKKQTVNESLFEDLREARQMLTDSFSAWNKGVDKETLDEGVQKILDRLVFIRVLEDRGLEPPILKKMIHERDAKGTNVQLFDLLIEKFRELDEYYNSNLFSPHACEKWVEYDDKLKKVILMLYGVGAYEYDFKQIPADVLGGVYESYLSYIGQNPISVGYSKGKLFELDSKSEIKIKSRKKRKEQGIYYTPKFIVDYIVKNTLGEKLKEIKTINELKGLKVLDPACGSGSFLTKAMEIINEKYKEFGASGDQSIKTNILLENIYGVDLDAQAVELARLNLLIDALDTKAKLPNLIKNVKNGNSLISGTKEELKKYFGDNWRDKKPFDWKEEFSGVFRQGGFDVIIGNPPYVRVDSLSDDEKKYWKNVFSVTEGKYDLYYLFIEKSLELLKGGGLLGFIVPNKFCVADSAFELRDFIINITSQRKFLSVSSIDVFSSASNYPVIILFKKGEKGGYLELAHADHEDQLNSQNYGAFKISVEELEILPSKLIPINIERNQLELVIKLLKENNERVVDYLGISEGLRIPVEYESVEKTENPIVKQYQFCRYSSIKDGVNISDVNLGKILKVTSGRYISVMKEKLLIAEDALKIEATLDVNNMIPQGGVYFCTLKDKTLHINYLLGLLNSKLFSFIYKILFGGMHMGGGYLRYRTTFLNELPLNICSEICQKEILGLVDKILDLNRQLHLMSENSEKYNSLKLEIEKTDKIIDQKVYELYGLTEEEIGVVEGSK